MVQALCPKCGKHTDGELVDHEMHIFVVCSECEVILAVLPKFFQKATWKAGVPRGEGEDIELTPSAPKKAGPEPGAAVLRDLEKKKKADDRRLRWS